MQNHPPPSAGRRTLLLLLSGVLLLTFGWILTSDVEAQADGVVAAAQGPSGSSDETLAVVEGQKITRKQAEEAASEALETLELQKMQFEVRMEQERQKAIQQAVEKMVEDRLLELEAEARGTTVDELLAAEAGVQPVTDEEVDAFYAELQASGRPGLPPKENIAGQIRTHLAEQREQGRRGAFLEELQAKYGSEIYIGEPRLEVETAGHPAKGPESAPVTIVEFSDFECPYCSRVVPTLEQVRENYGDKVRLVFRQFPLQMHENAQKAAEASLCAHEQGKFWEMHDAMFENQRALGLDQLKRTAGDLGLDKETFARCLDSGEYADEVAADFRAGTVLGVSGTPALFINGRFLNGAQPYEVISQIIDEELEKQEG